MPLVLAYSAHKSAYRTGGEGCSAVLLFWGYHERAGDIGAWIAQGHPTGDPEAEDPRANGA